LQRNNITNEDKGVRPLLQNIVMKEELFEEEEEVHGLEDSPFLTRVTYQEALSKATARELVVAAEQRADQQLVLPSLKNLCPKPAYLHMAMQICQFSSLFMSLVQ